MRLAATVAAIATIATIATIAAIAFLTAEPSARADVIPDGYKGVRHDISFDGLAEQADYTFVLFPTSIDGGARIVADGEDVRFYHMVSPYLYAVPGELPPIDEIEEIDEAWLADAGAVKSSYSLAMINSIQQSDPTEKIVTVHQVAGVTDDSVIMQPFDQYLDGNGEPINDQRRFLQHAMPWILTGIGISLALIMFGRRQTPPKRPESIGETAEPAPTEPGAPMDATAVQKDPEPSATT